MRISFCVKDFEKDRVESALRTIFDTNVMRFGDGKLGAVNGMTQSGQLEIVSMQSEEIWTGVTYGLTSTMIMEVNLSDKYFRNDLFLFCDRIFERKDFSPHKESTIPVIMSLV